MGTKVSLFILSLLTLLCFSCSDDKAPADADDNFITSLTLEKDSKTYEAVINGSSIVVTVPYNVDLNGAKANMAYTPSAKILPNPTTIKDWDIDKVFRVTSYNGDVNEYTYSVIKAEIKSNGDVLLNTQEDVDNFASTDITIISGNLVIGSNNTDATSISDLSGLSKIKEVQGKIIVKNSFNGESVDGLNMTKSGGIEIGTLESPSACDNLYRLHFENLNEIDGNISVFCSAIQFFEFDNITNINGDVKFESEAVKTIALPKLTNVNGNLELDSIGTAPITSVEFPVLKTVGGKLSVPKTDALESISLPLLEEAGSIDFHPGLGLSHLYIPEIKCVNGDLSIISFYNNQAWNEYGNTKLERIDGLSKLEQVHGTITIIQFDGLEEFPNLSSLQLLGGIQIYRLKNLNGKTADLNLSNAVFKSFNNVKPFILINATEDARLFTKIITQDDLSNVDVTLRLAYTDEGLSPLINFKSVDNFNLEKLNLASSKSYELPLEKVNGSFYIALQNSNNKTIKLNKLQFVGGYLAIVPGMTTSLECSNLTEVGGQLFLGSTFKTLKFDALKQVCMAQEASFYRADEMPLKLLSSLDVNLPKLECVGGKGLAIYQAKSISLPLLSNVSGFDFLKLKCSDFNESFPNLQKLGSVKIDNCTKLKDFSAFAKFILENQILEDNWMISNCEYNPTYQEMKEGRYTPAE